MTPRAYGVDARFCPRCAEPLSGPPPTACAACGYALFVNARPTASLIVHEAGRFLALKRAIEPQAGRWETPGGFCDGWEHPADAALREAREELGVDVTLGQFVGMYVGSYVFQGESLPVLDCFFLATVQRDEIRVNAAEASDLRWFDLRQPPPLAFATMDAAIRDAAKLLIG